MQFLIIIFKKSFLEGVSKYIRVFGNSSMQFKYFGKEILNYIFFH